MGTVYMRKSPLGVLIGFVGMLIMVAIMATCSESESSMYSDVKNSKDYGRWYECTKYLDKYPNSKHSKEVSDIFYIEMKKEGKVDRIYKYGQKYSDLPIGRRLKDLAYELAILQNNSIIWDKYIEVAEPEDINNAYEYRENSN